MGTLQRKTLLMLAVAAFFPMLLTGCGSSATPGTGSSTAATGTPVTATETEFSITLSRTTFSPGTYTFDVHNNGTISHNLTINGPGVANQASPTIAPGTTGQVTVTLQNGSYELYCSIGTHKDQGMDLTIQVA
jgi:plastocyanin